MLLLVGTSWRGVSGAWVLGAWGSRGPPAGVMERLTPQGFAMCVLGCRGLPRGIQNPLEGPI